MILGFRFHAGLGNAVLWVMIPVVFGLAFASLVTTAALLWPRGIMVEAVQPVISLVTFCSGFVPVDKYPDWVQPLVRNQPMSPASDAMRMLALGGPVGSPDDRHGGVVTLTSGVCLVPIIGIPPDEHQSLVNDAEGKGPPCSAQRRSATCRSARSSMRRRRTHRLHRHLAGSGRRRSDVRGVRHA